MMVLAVVTQVALGKGGWQVQAPLLVHVAAGLVAIVLGYVALYAAKGARLHRRGGTLFVYAMLVMGLVGAAIAAYEGKPGSVNGGLIAAYMVTTALLTVRPPNATTRRLSIAAMLVVLAASATNIALGIDSAMHGARVRNGVPVPAYIIIGAIALASGLSDARLLRAGPPRGRARIVRHLWRMCFALFVATGSFFLGQAKVIPKPLRIQPLLLTLALLPLASMLYWLVRVRFRGWQRRMRFASVVPVQRERHELGVVAAAGRDHDVLHAGRGAVGDGVRVAAPGA
jgi:uncharacterized membrane protein